MSLQSGEPMLVALSLRPHFSPGQTLSTLSLHISSSAGGWGQAHETVLLIVGEFIAEAQAWPRLTALSP